MRQQLILSDKVAVLNNSKVTEIKGEKFVKAIKVDNAGKEVILPLEGVFVEIGLIPNSEFSGIIEKNEYGEIKVNRFNETNIEGVFAAGDVTDVPEKQIIIAAGEGAKAALSAFRYLIQNKLIS